MSHSQHDQLDDYEFVPPAARDQPKEILDSATRGASMLDASAATKQGRNLLAHALAELRRDGFLQLEPVRTGTAERIAAAFHEAYERLAPAHGYQTREASAKPWDQVPEQNRQLMVAVVAELLERGIVTEPTATIDFMNLPGDEPDAFVIVISGWRSGLDELDRARIKEVCGARAVLVFEQPVEVA